MPKKEGNLYFNRFEEVTAQEVMKTKQESETFPLNDSRLKNGKPSARGKINAFWIGYFILQKKRQKTASISFFPILAKY